MKLRKQLTSTLLAFLMLLSTAVFADPTWVDVRSEREHKVDNIEGDLRVTHVDIVREAGELFPNKDAELMLYCRSGGRAGKAMKALQNAGYTNVSNAGGIDDARRARGLKSH